MEEQDQLAEYNKTATLLKESRESAEHIARTIATAGARMKEWYRIRIPNYGMPSPPNEMADYSLDATAWPDGIAISETFAEYCRLRKCLAVLWEQLADYQKNKANPPEYYDPEPRDLAGF